LNNIVFGLCLCVVGLIVLCSPLYGQRKRLCHLCPKPLGCLSGCNNGCVQVGGIEDYYQLTHPHLKQRQVTYFSAQKVQYGPDQPCLQLAETWSTNDFIYPFYADGYCGHTATVPVLFFGCGITLVPEITNSICWAVRVDGSGSYSEVWTGCVGQVLEVPFVSPVITNILSTGLCDGPGLQSVTNISWILREWVQP